jgi:nucleotide-binding universal stress UspA family protein
MATNLNARLVFANVINRRDINAVRQAVSHISESLSADGYADRLKHERAEKMQRLIEETKCTHISHRIIIRTGIPFVELINLAEEVQADLVIMGAKGRGELSGMLFGSTAEKMFRRCPVPLLSIREKVDQVGLEAPLQPLFVSNLI